MILTEQAYNPANPGHRALVAEALATARLMAYDRYAAVKQVFGWNGISASPGDIEQAITDSYQERI